jgi:hypothetical protein
MNRPPLRHVLAIAVMVLVASCASAAPGPSPSQAHPAASATRAATAAPTANPASPSQGSGEGLVRVHDPGEVTGTEPAHCRFRDGGKLPDPDCTPGSIDPAVTQADIGTTICRAGYTTTVRPPESQTEHFKFGEAYPAYGLPESTRTELDHLVSLELGGSNAAANLWPEAPPTPNPKDEVENALHRAVCDGDVTLAAAQRAIAQDWMTAESRLGIG